jgi:hypothetical protein
MGDMGIGQVVSSEKQQDEWNYELQRSEETGHRLHIRQTEDAAVHFFSLVN